MKNKLIKEVFQTYIEWLLDKLPDWSTGRTNVLDEKFCNRYGEKDCTELIRTIKLNNLKSYIVTIIIFIFFISLIVINNLFPQNSDSLIKKNGNLLYIERPKIGEKSEQFNIHVELEQQSQKIQKDLELNVNSREMTNKQKEKILERYAVALPDRILGNNKSLQKVTKPLNLYERDNEHDITIDWSTSNPDVISKTGQVSLIQSHKGKKVILSAEITLGDINKTKNINITVIKPINKKDYAVLLEGKAVTLIEELENSQIGDSLELPQYLPEGISVNWSTAKNSHSVLMFFLFLVIMYAIFQNRYQKIDKELKIANDSMLKDFPELVHKLVLLLNAGLVPTTALSKMTDDYSVSTTERRILYEELCEIQRRVKETNHSIIVELRDFSKRTGIRELMRFSTILAENINKGTALAEKLEAEVELLWMSRKKKAEEKGRLAETKLTMPLVILLIVLIVITIAPALMEM